MTHSLDTSLHLALRLTGMVQFKDADSLANAYRNKFPADGEGAAWLCREYAGDPAGVRSLAVFANDWLTEKSRSGPDRDEEGLAGSEEYGCGHHGARARDRAERQDLRAAGRGGGPELRRSGISVALPVCPLPPPRLGFSLLVFKTEELAIN